MTRDHPTPLAAPAIRRTLHRSLPVVAIGTVAAICVIGAVVLLALQPWADRLSANKHASCTFYTSDAAIRRQQAANSTLLIKQVRAHVTKLATLELHAPLATGELERDDVAVWNAYTTATQANVALNLAIAERADTLATSLHCPRPEPEVHPK